MWNGINRRKFPRAKYKCLIYIKKKGSSKSISTYTENIGAGGICVIIKDNLILFQGVNVELFLEQDDSPIKCAGTVVWVVKKRPEKREEDYCYDTGIEFVNIEERERKKVLNVVEAILKNKPELLDKQKSM